MAIENAKKFVEKVQADAALSERVKAMTPQEGMALAKELGLEFTEEELKDALNNRELEPEELDEGVGGTAHSGTTLGGGFVSAVKQQTCEYSPNLRHKWEYIGHSEEPHSFLWIDYTWGYDHYKCVYCGKKEKWHV